MPGKNNGTGRPLSFQCWRCRRRKARSRIPFQRIDLQERGRADRVWLTGAKKYIGVNCGCRNDEYTREYICEDCNHRGWSRHSDLAQEERREDTYGGVREVLEQSVHSVYS